MFGASICLLQAAVAQNARNDAPRPIVAIESVSIVHVVHGELLAPRTVLIAGGRIVTVAETDSFGIPPTAQRVDGHGLYLMPGLTDMHVHLFNNASGRTPNDWAFPLFIANGVTGVREMAAKTDDLPTVAAWRRAVVERRLIAPHVLAAGVVVRGGSTSSAQQQVRDAHAAGADFVKVFSALREEEWRAVIEQARTLKISVCGHVPATVPLSDAAEAGQRSNEHLMQVYEACSSKEAHWLATRRAVSERAVSLRDEQEPAVLESFDQSICDRVAGALARTAQVQVPTLVLPHFEGSAIDMHDLRWRYLREDEQKRWQRISHDMPPPDRQLNARRVEVSRRIVHSLHAAAVRVLVGTDTPMPQVYPGWSLHKELELLVEAGLTPADALRAATVWPAEFRGVSERSGSVAEGKCADLLLLEANPLDEITNTQRIRAVVLEGRLLQRTDLDELLSRAAAQSAGK